MLTENEEHGNTDDFVCLECNETVEIIDDMGTMIVAPVIKDAAVDLENTF